MSQVPSNNRLVTGRGKKKVRVLGGRGEAGYPVTVPFEGTAKRKGFGRSRHGEDAIMQGVQVGRPVAILPVFTY